MIVIEHSQNRGAILSCATGQLLSMEECALPRPAGAAASAGEPDDFQNVRFPVAISKFVKPLDYLEGRREDGDRQPS